MDIASMSPEQRVAERQRLVSAMKRAQKANQGLTCAVFDAVLEQISEKDRASIKGIFEDLCKIDKMGEVSAKQLIVSVGIWLALEEDLYAAVR